MAADILTGKKVDSQEIPKGLARKTTELACSAESIAACPENFLARIGLGSGFKKLLQGHLGRLRAAEQDFYGTITLRLHLLVKRQALDREGWDFLLACRDSFRSSTRALSMPSVGAVRIPAGAEERLQAIGSIGEFLENEPGLTDETRGVTSQRAGQIVRKAEALLSESNSLNRQLTHAAARMQSEGSQIESLLQSMRSAVIQNLGKVDLRWAGAAVQSRITDRDPAGLFADSSGMAGSSARGCPPTPNLFGEPQGRGWLSMSIMAALSMLLPASGSAEYALGSGLRPIRACKVGS